MLKATLKAGQQVKIARERRGLTVLELSKLAGVSRVFLSALEGGGDVRMTTLDRVCKALGISMEELFAIERGTT